MPYVTSVERITLEQEYDKRMEKGILTGKIQMLQQILGEVEISREELSEMPVEQQEAMFAALQARMRERQAGKQA